MICASTGAMAQEAGQDADSATKTGNIIIVTAKQRAQNLQEVQLAIAVLNAEQLEERGVSDVRDLAAFTPNFNITSASGRQDASGINIRGLAPNTSDERYQPVSFFVDGIALGGVVVGLQTLDLERVEVIKGPQSATFGRATYAGAIDFITTTPDLNNYSGRVKAQISSNTWDTVNSEVGVFLEGPIIQDKLSASLYVQNTIQDGFPTVAGYDIPEFGEEKTFSLNGVIFAQLSSNTTLKLRGIYAAERDAPTMVHVTHPLYWEREGANIYELSPATATTNANVWIDGAVPNPLRDGIWGADLNNPRQGTPSGGGYDRERYFGSAILEHNFDSGFNLSYRGSYLFNQYDAYVDFFERPASGVDAVFGDLSTQLNGSNGLAFPFLFAEEFEETSHQLRLLSPDADRFRWGVGGYYFWSRDTNLRDNNASLAPREFNPDLKTRGDERIINYALFGSLAFDISDQLTVSAEGRWQKESVEFDRQDEAIGSTSIPEFDLKQKRDSFEPRITVEYSPTPDNLIYALFAKGTKSGRFNTSSSVRFPAGDPRGTPVGIGTPRPAEGFVFADPEELWNYEIGSKNTLLDGRMTLNAAAFYQEIKDQQLRTTVFINGDFDGDGFNDSVTVISNAGDSRIYGFELDTSIEINDQLDFLLGVGYANHEFTDETATPADEQLFGPGETLKGKTTVSTPDWTGNASLEYFTPISDDLDLKLRADVIYTGKMYTELANISYVPAKTHINLRSTVMGASWDVSLFVKNLLNDKTAVTTGNTGSYGCEFRNTVVGGANAAGQACIGLVPQRGREVGLSFSKDF